MTEATIPSRVSEQSTLYGRKARFNRRVYVSMKTTQIVIAAAIPVVSVFADAAIQRYTNAVLGALVGVIEGVLGLGQYQQNWLLYRATREALRREESLFSEAAGPYAQVGQTGRQLFVERCDAITSGESAKWLKSNQPPTKE